MKMARISTSAALAALLAGSVLAQAAKPATSTAAPAAGASSVPVAGSTKIGFIRLQLAVAATNEGQRDLQALNKKFEPDVNKLQALSKEVEDLQTKIKAGDKLNPDVLAGYQRDLETKTTAGKRMQEDLQNAAAREQDAIAGRILQKMGPILAKYAQDNGFAAVIAETTFDEGGRLLWESPSNGVDVTKAIVDAYNAQSNVPPPAPPPATSGAVKPAGTTAAQPKPAGTNPK